jgi:ribonucleotide reductase alpha subunit
MNKEYTYQEVYDATLAYFQGDELATNVWISKYCKKDLDEETGVTHYYEKTPDDMHRRLAKEYCRAGMKYNNPLTEDEIYELFKGFKYILPQGRPMAGIGVDDYVSLSNCFLLGYPGEDSIGSIYRTLQEVAQISKRGGGTGIDLSDYRSSNAKVHNAALTSSGVVSWAELFSNTIEKIGQSGRRAALMECLDINHPDAEKFIDAKLEEGKINGANISLKVNDEWLNSFMDKDVNDPTYNRENKRLWDKIIHNAWYRAEPGLLFWSTVLNESVPDCYADEGFRSVGTNPCQPKWAHFLTPDGIRTVGETNVGDVIWSQEGWTKILRKESSGVKEVYEFKTTAGSFFGTKEHRIISKGKKIEVGNAISIDLLAGDKNENVEIIPEIVMDGMVVGDGMLHKASNNLVLLIIGNDDSDYFTSEIKHLIGRFRPGISDKSYEVKTSIKCDELPYTFERKIPERYKRGNTNEVCSFLRGLYTANGSVVDKRVQLKTTSFEMVKGVQLLLSSVGIRSYYTTNKTHKVKFSNGEYDVKESYDICISTDRELFSKKIGFIQKYKNEKLEKTFGTTSRHHKTHKIIDTKYLSTEEVFNITVDNVSHTYWSDNLNVANCGEVILSPKDSCRLMLFNLYSYVKQPFTKTAYFDFDLFEDHCRKMVKLMDNMIDLEIEKVDRIISKVENDPENKDTKNIELRLWKDIQENCKKGRRCGIGITAEGDMLAALGLQYGTEKATFIAEQVHHFMAEKIYLASCDLVQVDGREKFPVFDWEKEKNNPFIQRLLNVQGNVSRKQMEAKMSQGRRNIALMTIAPAGSCSILTQTTSGIEPVFLPFYDRKRKIEKGSVEKPDFIDTVGDWFMSYNVIHHKLITWYSIQKRIPFTEAKEYLSKLSKEELQKLYETSPYYKASSADVDWKAKVEMQGKIQKYIDHSISVTCNIPKDTPESVVAELYETAWKSGCKGCTIYREGSRVGILTSTEETNRQLGKNECYDTEKKIKKRPKTLPCKVVRFTNKGEKWVAVVGLDNDEPYEIFTGLLDKISLPQWVEEGSITRLKEKKMVIDELTGEEVEIDVSRYDLQYKDKDGYNVTMEGLNRCFNEEYYNYSKLISGLLRHGMPIEYIIKTISSLNLDHGNTNINSWKNGVIRALGKFIKKSDGDEDSEGLVKCPKCGELKYKKEGKCGICFNCGYSICG